MLYCISTSCNDLISWTAAVAAAAAGFLLYSEWVREGASRKMETKAELIDSILKMIG